MCPSVGRNRIGTCVTLLTSGPLAGDIYPVTTLERVYIIFVAILGPYRCVGPWGEQFLVARGARAGDEHPSAHRCPQGALWGMLYRRALLGRLPLRAFRRYCEVRPTPQDLLGRGRLVHANHTVHTMVRRTPRRRGPICCMLAHGIV